MNKILSILLISALASTAWAQEKSETIHTNSLGMKFVEVPGTSSWFSQFETRVRDFRPFVKSENVRWPRASFPQTLNHPAVNVSWDNAVRFCRWLTEREDRAGELPEGRHYRLPSSPEWTQAVAIATPSDLERGDFTRETYAWAGSWPPPRNVANYAPELQADKYSYTSAVGSFKPNRYGLYDMSGNAWEWCYDAFSMSPNLRVLRGGSWRTRRSSNLDLRVEIGNFSDLKLATYGFRVVLATSDPNFQSSSQSKSLDTVESAAKVAGAGE